jgi:hypothetical protein
MAVSELVRRRYTVCDKGKSLRGARVVTESWLWDLVVPCTQSQVRSTPPRTGVQVFSRRRPT